MNRSSPADIIGRGVVAGAAGGIAEIIWIFAYASATGTDAAFLARGVTTASGVNTLVQGSSAAFGIGIHMTLAVTLGIALAFAWTALSHRWPKVSPYAVMPAVLTGVWAINFLIILPLVDPNFVQIVPYPVSLISKLLFGVAAAVALSNRRHESTPIPASN
jgi:RsiW-degrading membrane proteinase PrsW (M82 family)